MQRLGCCLLMAAAATGCAAHGLGSLAEVAIIDRDTGERLTPHFYRGEYWIAGRPGDRYAIDIRNATGDRLLAVTSVDGVNVVSGETAGWNQAGYVYASGQRSEITGWRKSDAEVAAFVFTASADSYADRTGRPENVGVIGVAVFRERLGVVEAAPFAAGPPSAPSDPARDRRDLPAAEARGGSRAAPAPSVMPPAAAAPLAQLGTGHGEREASHAGHTLFIRERDQPDEVIRIRYESLERLVAMGIVRRPGPRPVRPGANPFPAFPGEGYVPDPPG